MNTIEDFSNALADFLAQENERAALIFAFSLLEQFVDDLIKIKTKHHNSYERLSTSLKLNILNEAGAVEDKECEAINWLRKKRNEAAHRPGFKVHESEIKESWIMVSMKNKTKLQNYLAATVIGFWNNHLEISTFYSFVTTKTY